MWKLINDFSWGLFFWQALILIVLIFLLKKFAWKPILNALNDREEKIERDLASAEEAKKEMKELKSSNEILLKEAREERDEILKEARKMKEDMIAEASGEAKEKADKIIENAKSVIEKEKKDAIEELKGQVAGLSIEIAEKVIRKELDDKNDQMQLVDGILREVEVSEN